MKFTQATFKLATHYTGWNDQVTPLINSYGACGSPIDFIMFHHFAIKMQLSKESISYQEYSLASQASLQNKFCHPQMDKQSIYSMLDYSLHIDPNKYCEFLAKYSNAHGVKAISAEMKDFSLDEKTGFITSITLDNQVTLEADLFIDCSGNEAALIDKAVDVEYETWSNHFPANKLIGLVVENKEQIETSTKIKSVEHGWLRYTPLFNSTRIEFIFNRNEISEAEALIILQNNTDAKIIEQNIAIDLHPGQRKTQWHKNCISFGKSAGYYEPLLTSYIHSIHSQIKRFIQLIPDMTFNKAIIKEFNRISHLENENIRDLLLIYYVFQKQQKSLFWQAWQKDDLPSTLEHKNALFLSQGQVAYFDHEFLTGNYRAASYITLGAWPKGHSPLLESFDIADLKSRYISLKTHIEQSVPQMPNHKEYIENYCASLLS